LAELSPSAQRGLVLLMNNLLMWEAEDRAMLLLIFRPELTNKQITELCGVHRCTLYAWPRFKRLKAILSHPPDLPQGEVSEDGNILEAWFDAEE